jgi:hypothetical protein
MPRIVLIPAPTADGRHVIFRVAVLSRREQLRRLLDRWRRRRR